MRAACCSLTDAPFNPKSKLRRGSPPARQTATKTRAKAIVRKMLRRIAREIRSEIRGGGSFSWEGAPQVLRTAAILSGEFKRISPNLSRFWREGVPLSIFAPSLLLSHLRATRTKLRCIQLYFFPLRTEQPAVGPARSQEGSRDLGGVWAILAGRLLRESQMGVTAPPPPLPDETRAARQKTPV